MVDEAVRLGQTVSYVAASPHMAKVYGAINVLYARLEAAEAALVAADEMRGFFGSMDARYPSRTTAAVLGYDAARAAWEKPR